MTTAQAIIEIKHSLINFLDASELWNDDVYETEVIALAVLGYAKAIEVCKEMDYSLK